VRIIQPIATFTLKKLSAKMRKAAIILAVEQ
jgi:hypothetical protein